MSTNDSPTYAMTLSLNVLNHLGIGLYSNVPAVLSEAIANAWDADATRVSIDIDAKGGRIVIQDDGHGMTVADANRKYLTVGYKRREDPSGGAKTPSGRPVMGRKGIGKLSLFSIAGTVEVHSVKDGESHGFTMNISDIRDSALDGGSGEYHPAPVDAAQIDLTEGTRITLSDMKRRLHQTETALRRRLARRFSIIGESQHFSIVLNGKQVTIADRGYHDKLQYIWPFGQRGKEIANMAKDAKRISALPSVVEVGDSKYNIDGWIGTASKPGDLKDRETGESINGIVVMVRGKLAQENILDEFGDENLYSEYVIGEVHADFLDLDDKEDIATSSRQRLIEEDSRYQALKQTLGNGLKTVQNEWRERRNQDGRKIAITIPQIEEWYNSLTPDHKKNAERLFGRINQLPISDDTEKRRIFIGAILAFENLRFRNMVNRLDNVSVENISAFADIFDQIDDLEQSAYYQITRNRIEVIRKLSNLVDENAKERAIQEHIYKHLWLLDPSWERATHTERMEKQIRTALDGSKVLLSDEEKRARLDIYYATTGNRHVIIELKRASVAIRTTGLVDQIDRYRGPALRILEAHGKGNEPLEFVCIVGKRPPDWDDRPNGEQVSRDLLDAISARLVMYDNLIENALEAYQNYVDKADEAGRVYRLIRGIENTDADAMHPAD